MPQLSGAAALRIIDSVAIVLSQALQLARARIASASSPVMRMTAERDHAVGELALLRREIDILRGQRNAMPPHHRPFYSPEQRLAILQLMRLRNWSVAVVAKRVVLHPNTVRAWIKAVEGRGNERLLSPAIAWNRIDDAIRWATQELRRLCPEPEIGTRTIARHLLRAGVAISRTTVQRVLREPKTGKPRPRRPEPVAAGVDSHHLLTPTEPNEVWHLDLTTLRVLWLRFTVAAVLDGFTRRLVALRVFDRAPRTNQMTALVWSAADEHGRPRFVITDHGPPFRKRFAAVMKDLGVHHVRARVGQPFLNGKVERLFRSLRAWWRLVLPTLTVGGLRSKLNNFQRWYNEHRVHAALGARTPSEMADRTRPLAAIAIRQRDSRCPAVEIKRRPCRGDPRLPIIDIAVKMRRAA